MYTFANASVKMANKRFTSIDNDYCISFHKESKVEACEEDDDIKSVNFNFSSLSDIEQMVQSRTVDVIGVILDVGQTSSINTRDGKSRQKRTLTIGDESNVCIGVTLWGQVAEAHPYSTGQVMALKNCRVSDYNGKSLNASSHSEDVFIGGIKHKRSQELAQWLSGSRMSDLKGEMRSVGDAPADREPGAKK